MFLFSCRCCVLLLSAAHILGTTHNSLVAVSCGLLIFSRFIRFLSYFVALISFTHNFCNLLLYSSFFVFRFHTSSQTVILNHCHLFLFLLIYSIVRSFFDLVFNALLFLCCCIFLSVSLARFPY